MDNIQFTEEKIGTKEESASARAIQRNDAFNGPTTKGFVWNEEKISYVPPFPPPDSKYPYVWNEETESWDEFPGYPRD